VEHSIWLGLMRDRIELIKNLLSNDGSIWISIDDDESHYLKILCDEIFGRMNFVANVIWEKKSSPQNDAKWISDCHDHILVFAKNKEIWRPFKLNRTEVQNSIYNNSDEFDGIDNNGKYYGRGTWFAGDMTVKTVTEKAIYPIITPSGREVWPAKGRAWVYYAEKFQEMVKDNRITFGKDGNNKPCIKRFLSEIENNGIVPKSVWSYKDVGENRNARQEVMKFNEGEPFATPKPERLLERILTLSSSPGDLVLDSFAGSGTTGAVAHKMGRRWIMVELGEHCHTHIIPRLRKVIDGEDKGGISEAVNWKGGGGFRYYKVAPSLLEKDKWGNWIINKQYNAAMLAEAVCKLEGFTYNPSDSIYWMHGKSTETDFIYVTTQNMGRDQLALLSGEVGGNRTLLVMCTAFRARTDDFPNLTIKKIPNTVLSKCEWGHDDYSMQVENLPAAPKPVKKQGVLFNMEDE
jgi:adenine-specific DNA-methyltransferase